MRLENSETWRPSVVHFSSQITPTRIHFFLLALIILSVTSFSYQQNTFFESAWVAGSRGPQQYPVYGTQGVANVSNVPGCRHAAAGWYDPVGQEYWLFGGLGFVADASYGTRKPKQKNVSRMHLAEGSNFSL